MNYCNRAKTEKLLPFFFPKDTKLTSKLFFGSLRCDIFCSFAFVLEYISLIHGRRVKDTLSIKILVLCSLELESCGFRKTKKF